MSVLEAFSSQWERGHEPEGKGRGEVTLQQAGPGRAAAWRPCALEGVGGELEVKPTSLPHPSTQHPQLHLWWAERDVGPDKRFLMYLLLP